MSASPSLNFLQPPCSFCCGRHAGAARAVRARRRPAAGQRRQAAGFPGPASCVPGKAGARARPRQCEGGRRPGPAQPSAPGPGEQRRRGAGPLQLARGATLARALQRDAGGRRRGAAAAQPGRRSRPGPRQRARRFHAVPLRPARAARRATRGRRICGAPLWRRWRAGRLPQLPWQQPRR